ncbi:MFS transporter [Rhizobium giardinii]|uniref:Major facilitator superfamily (MFS) profile domain-containing protein n=1 Tax=Rhizobium giardinii TaxID=56731 RepID=A0A7W8XAT0_9HYPH|nr:MFS transporter [Rhizobium giardinii]MBB5537981.1 hypothetical protein [Rhizobium giardinii]
MPIAGFLADRFHRKNMLTIGTAPFALFGCLPAVLNDLNSVLIARLVFGCVEAVIMTCCTTLIADYSNGEERSKCPIARWLRLGSSDRSSSSSAPPSAKPPGAKGLWCALALDRHLDLFFRGDTITECCKLPLQRRRSNSMGDAPNDLKKLHLSDHCSLAKPVSRLPVIV